MTAKFLGKQPARPGAVALALATYMPAPLPNIPPDYGHEGLIGSGWGMLANDRASCCVFSQMAHSSMLWRAEAGAAPAGYNDVTVLADYSAVTGYNPNAAAPDGSNPTDQGTDMGHAMAYWQNVGIQDPAGGRHKIGVSLSLDPSSPQFIDQLHTAGYVLDGLSIGINCCDQWLEAFDAGQPWGTVDNPTYEQGGGHCIAGVCWRNGMPGLVTWGRVQWCAPAGLEQFVDECYVLGAPERMRPNGVDADGFNWSQLLADKAALLNVA